MTNDQETTDLSWNEYDYHNGPGAHAKAPKPVRMFPDQDDEDETEEFEFSFAGLPTTPLTASGDNSKRPIVIRGESVCGNTKVLKSTGFAVWSGGDVLATYLVANRMALIHDKDVLELGAGTGIAGIVAHNAGASRVLWTDGDADTLQNLRYNVAQNLPHLLAHQENDVSSSASLSPSQSMSLSVSQLCPQLIWGQSLDWFRNKYGTFDVIIASDCIYMEKCVEPFWDTVDALLNKDGTLIFVNTCISQAPHHVVAAAGKRRHFLENSVTDLHVHLFRRV